MQEDPVEPLARAERSRVKNEPVGVKFRYEGATAAEVGLPLKRPDNDTEERKNRVDREVAADRARGPAAIWGVV